MIRAIASTIAITSGVAFLCALAGGILAEQTGAELGLIVGGVLGLGIGFRYSVDMAAVAAARRDAEDARSMEHHLQERRSRQDPFGETSKGAYLRDRRGEVWRALAAKRRARLAGSPHTRFTSQRHHDLELADIGIRRKSKPKRR